MALTELENARANKTLGEFIDRRRPAPHVRHELDLGYRVPGQSVEVYEVRPAWDRPGERMERPIAKATFVRTQDVWQVYLAACRSQMASV